LRFWQDLHCSGRSLYLMLITPLHHVIAKHTATTKHASAQTQVFGRTSDTASHINAPATNPIIVWACDAIKTVISMLLTPYMQNTAKVIPYIIDPINHANMPQALFLSKSVTTPPKHAITNAKESADVINNPIAVKILLFNPILPSFRRNCKIRSTVL